MPYTEHPSAGDLPQDHTVIWRFMNLAKFLSTIATSSLYFCQASILRKIDPYEGSQSLPALQFYQLLSSNEAFARQVFKIPQDQALPPNLKEAFSPALHKNLDAIFASTG